MHRFILMPVEELGSYFRPKTLAAVQSLYLILGAVIGERRHSNVGPTCFEKGNLGRNQAVAHELQAHPSRSPHAAVTLLSRLSVAFLPPPAFKVRSNGLTKNDGGSFLLPVLLAD